MDEKNYKKILLLQKLAKAIGVDIPVREKKKNVKRYFYICKTDE